MELGDPIRVIEVTPIDVPVPTEAPLEPDEQPAPSEEPVEVPA